MNWAWGWPLPPAPKLILLALADIADDSGVCFPSVSYVARKVTLGKRATQRRIQELSEAGLIRVESRVRKDGSHSSNRYYLSIHRPNSDGSGVESTPPTPVVPTDRVMHAVTRPPVHICTPLTTKDTLIRNTTDVGVGHLALALPNSWPTGLRDGATKCLIGMSADQSQTIVDELAGQMLIRKITSPLAYLRALRASHERGDFLPEVAHGVRARREAQAKQIEATQAVSQPSSKAVALEAIAKAKARSTGGRKENA